MYQIALMKNVLKMSLLLILIAGCGHSSEIKKTDPLESGRGFIESSLREDYDDAQKYILQDSTNVQFFNRFRDFNSNKSDAEKDGYRNSNILIDSIQKISDTVTIISYSNTYKNKPLKLKMVKKGNEWMVDFKYTFTGNEQPFPVDNK
jgi:type IV secretory pathway component VirB8